MAELLVVSKVARLPVPDPNTVNISPVDEAYDCDRDKILPASIQLPSVTVQVDEIVAKAPVIFRMAPALLVVFDRCTRR